MREVVSVCGVEISIYSDRFTPAGFIDVMVGDDHKGYITPGDLVKLVAKIVKKKKRK